MTFDLVHYCTRFFPIVNFIIFVQVSVDSHKAITATPFKFPLKGILSRLDLFPMSLVVYLNSSVGTIWTSRSSRKMLYNQAVFEQN